MKTLSKNITWAILTLITVALVFSLFLGTGREPQVLSINELVLKINKNEVSKMLVQGNSLFIELKDGSRATARKESETGLSDTLKNYGVDTASLRAVNLAVQDESGLRFWAGILIPTLLPLIVIVAIFWFVFNIYITRQRHK